jgi:hypothetical protein
MVAKSLRDWGIEDRVLSVICDNASNNDAMIQKLEILGFKRLNAGGRVRCFAHVLNLVVGVSETHVQTFNRSTFTTDKRLNVETFQAVIEGATGLPWSSDDDEVVHDFMPGDDLDVEVEHVEEPEEADWVVDQPILDELRLPRVPFTQQTAAPTQTGPAASTRSAGPVVEETASQASTVVTVEDKSASATRASQDVMREALQKVSSLAAFERLNV